MIEAAGGILWRLRADGAREVALVYRPRYEDWTLPKGKRSEDESPLQTAVREVQEETGYQPEVKGFVGAVSYGTVDGPKLVRYWHMVPMPGRPGPMDPDEVAELAWLPPREAFVKLSYPTEKAILDAWEELIAGS